jgi:hypothetical protein
MAAPEFVDRRRRMFVQRQKFVNRQPHLEAGQFEMAGARTVPVRSAWQWRNLENSPGAFNIERAADGDRPRSGQTDSLPNF